MKARMVVLAVAACAVLHGGIALAESQVPSIQNVTAYVVANYDSKEDGVYKKRFVANGYDCNVALRNEGDTPFFEIEISGEQVESEQIFHDARSNGLADGDWRGDWVYGVSIVVSSNPYKWDRRDRVRLHTHYDRKLREIAQILQREHSF